MANIKSQIKRIKTNESRRLKNQVVTSKIKTYIMKFDKAIESGDRETAGKVMKTTVVILDKAMAKGIIHPNNAANKKSRMMKKFHLLQDREPVAETPQKAPRASKKSPAKTTKKKSAKPKK